MEKTSSKEQRGRDKAETAEGENSSKSIPGHNERNIGRKQPKNGPDQTERTKTAPIAGKNSYKGHMN